MEKEKIKLTSSEKLVEEPLESASGEIQPIETMPGETMPVGHSESVLEPVHEIKSPAVFLKANMLPAAKFVLIPLVCVALSAFLFLPMVTEWILHNSYLRTAVLCAFIWNLVGAVLFAQARQDWDRRMIALIFAVPLATAWLWAIPLMSIIPTLSYWLPPNLR